MTSGDPLREEGEIWIDGAEAGQTAVGLDSEELDLFVSGIESIEKGMRGRRRARAEAHPDLIG